MRTAVGFPFQRLRPNSSAPQSTDRLCNLGWRGVLRGRSKNRRTPDFGQDSFRWAPALWRRVRFVSPKRMAAAIVAWIVLLAPCDQPMFQRYRQQVYPRPGGLNWNEAREKPPISERRAKNSRGFLRPFRPARGQSSLAFALTAVARLVYDHPKLADKTPDP